MRRVLGDRHGTLNIRTIPDTDAADDVSRLAASWPALTRRGRGSRRRQCSPGPLDKVAEKWVEDTFKTDDARRQGRASCIVPAIDSTYLSSDSDEFERLATKVTTLHVGGFHVFGGTRARAERAARPTLRHGRFSGDPLAAASLLNRLQSLSTIPLLNTADFEAGVGFRIAGRDRLSAADGGRRRRRRAAGVRGRAHHRASKRARSACTWISRRSPTSTTTRAIP